MKQYVCEGCGVQFETEHRRRRKRIFCTQKCAAATIGKETLSGGISKQGPKRAFDCQRCGTRFIEERLAFDGRERKYCSLTCSRKSSLRRGGDKIVVEWGSPANCTKCGKEGPRDGKFFHYSKGRDYHYPHCRECVSKKGYEWARDNRERKARNNRQWYESNRERLTSIRKQWARDNKERVSAIKKRYRRMNPGAEKEGMDRWRAKNRERVRAHGHRYRAMKRATRVSSEPIEVPQIAKYAGEGCGICGKSINGGLKWPDPMSRSVDHIIPLSKGGSHTLENLQLAHLRCNLVKKDRMPEEMEVVS